MAKQKIKTEGKMYKAIELTQDTAKAALNTTVETVEASENFVQGIYKAGYDANYDALKVAKGYWDTTTEIRKDWVKLFAETGESVIDGKMNIDLPYRQEMMDFGKGMYDNVSKTFGNFIPKTKTAK